MKKLLFAIALLIPMAILASPYDDDWGKTPDDLEFYNEFSDETPEMPFTTTVIVDDSILRLYCTNSFSFMENKLAWVIRRCKGTKRMIMKIRKSMLNEYGKAKVKKKRGITEYTFTHKNVALSIINNPMGHQVEIIYYSMSPRKLKKQMKIRAAELEKARDAEEKRQASRF